ncbi:MAG TPA: hypothetical protein DCZ92_04730 [Elusimicrobia bacterium]|nr:hypothetical protein [Elusimicrobiota bacterium]
MVFDIVRENGIDVVAQQAVIGVKVIYGFKHIRVEIAFIGVRVQAIGDGKSLSGGSLESGYRAEIYVLKVKRPVSREGRSVGEEHKE